LAKGSFRLLPVSFHTDSNLGSRASSKFQYDWFIRRETKATHGHVSLGYSTINTKLSNLLNDSTHYIFTQELNIVSTNLLETINSKRACPNCGQKKLITNDVEKFGEVVYNHCLNCNYEFSEDEQQRKYRDSKEKAGKGESSGNTGFALLIAIGAIILAIDLSQSNFGQSNTINEHNSRPADFEMSFIQP
jgi:DNA-directed RNA polymerase subunit RPC12/RpoP